MKTLLGTCHHDCPDSCGWEVTVDDAGRAVKMRGNPDHPYSRGELCPKVNRFLDRVYSPDRVLHPLIRVGAKGAGEFRSATWDEALALIAERTQAAITAHGASTVLPWWSAGNQSALSIGSLPVRFFDRMGASTTTGSLCGGTARTGFAMTMGSGMGLDPTEVVHSKLVWLWGTNTRVTNRHLWPFIEEARAAGAKVVVIDPVHTITADAADEVVQLRPGTDIELAMGIIHVLIRDGLVDRAYVDAHASGFDALVSAVAAWTPALAADACGIDASVVERMAHEFATVTPAMLRGLIGAEHRTRGAAVFRTLAIIPILTGAWRHRGGGMARSTGAWSWLGVDDDALAGAGATSARRPIPMVQLGRALTDPTYDPPITVLFCFNGNPMVSVPNAGLIQEGLMRDDLFTVVHEQFVTDTARFADVVLPAATQIEIDDVVPAWGHSILGVNHRAIEPLGESVSNTELFRRLAAAFGYDDVALQASDAELLDAALAPLSADDRAALDRDGFVPLAVPRMPYAEPTLTFDIGSKLPSPSPWTVPDAAFPLALQTTKSHQRFLNSSYSHLPKHGPAEGAPFVELSADDAAARGVCDGDTVVVANAQAKMELPARISTRVRPGVVSIPWGWWMHQHADGVAVNAITSDELTDAGGGVAYHDTWVELTPA
jgi:anaerobic selenocysteine-containing dehydrogenase